MQADDISLHEQIIKVQVGDTVRGRERHIPHRLARDYAHAKGERPLGNHSTDGTKSYDPENLPLEIDTYTLIPTPRSQGPVMQTYLSREAEQQSHSQIGY